ncbi:hypothetical protein AVEN_120101-1 [Araneus ventricosus]|uniref:Saposin B-type domain-containing protein n=1 Tax=Araneus ventricosus TaxID=182803 RepID=A0A4Y2G223_ARAVE|nr:hypothetical protein AVEN_120101-1 [Araneus ventricosus]
MSISLNQRKMESKLSIAVLFFLGLFVSVQGLSLAPENLAKYEKCLTCANCLSSLKVPQTINECIQILRPEEIESVFQSIHYHYKYESRNLHDAIEEYCKIDDAKKPDAYPKSLNGVQAFMKEIESVFQSIHYHYKYESRNLNDAIEEYCKIDDEKKRTIGCPCSAKESLGDLGGVDKNWPTKRKGRDFELTEKKSANQRCFRFNILGVIRTIARRFLFEF